MSLSPRAHGIKPRNVIFRYLIGDRGDQPRVNGESYVRLSGHNCFASSETHEKS